MKGFLFFIFMSASIVVLSDSFENITFKPLFFLDKTMCVGV